MEDKALQTIKTMLESRKIKVDTIETLANAIDETRMYNIGGVLVIFNEKSRLNESALQGYITFAEDNNYNSGTIVVSLVPPSENVINIVRSHINGKTPLLQIFDIRRLQFDITTHRRVPAHRIITADEVMKLEKKMNITDPKKQLPWIDSQDAMAKWIGAKPGDVVEIVRFSESGGNIMYYRYCVANVLDT